MTNHITNPFSLPPIVQVKVRLEEILIKLRGFINKNYMSTSDGTAKWNIKPEYIKKVHPCFNNFPLIPFSMDIDNTGFYAFDESFFNNILYREIPCIDIFYYIRFSTVCLMINLQTEETLVCVVGSSNFFIWTNEINRTIAIDRLELEYFNGKV